MKLPAVDRCRPDYRFERELGGLVAGVDEVGRAPLAGPVLAAAVILPPGADRDPTLAGIDDSKKLSASVRTRLAAAIRAVARIGLGAASVPEIDRLNIHHAALLAMGRAVAALDRRPDVVLVDGKYAPEVACRTVTVVGGDGLCLSVAAASIVAKVARDRLMHRLDSRHPGYGWADNAGYPTEEHVWGLLRRGPCRHHRMSFALPQAVAAHPGLGLRFGPLVEGYRTRGRLRLVRLRENLHAVADADGHHLGALRAARDGWTLQAVGYGAEDGGAPLTGAGPLAAGHGLALPGPRLEALEAALRCRGLTI